MNSNGPWHRLLSFFFSKDIEHLFQKQQITGVQKNANEAVNWTRVLKAIFTSGITFSAMVAIDPSFPFFPTFFMILAVFLGIIVVIGLISVPVVGALFGIRQGVTKLTEAFENKIVSTESLENDDGKGQLAVLPEDQQSEGQISLQDEKKQGQFALAKTKQTREG